MSGFRTSSPSTMHLSHHRRVVDKCTPRDKYAKTHVHLQNSFLSSSDDLSVKTVGLLKLLQPHMLIRSCSQAHLGSTRITHANDRSLPLIRKAGSICQLPSAQLSARVIMHHRRLRMMPPLNRTRTLSKSCIARCITLILIQPALIASMNSFSFRLQSHSSMYVTLKLFTTTLFLFLSSSPSNPVYVKARDCMTVQLPLMKTLSTIGMKTTPSSSKRLARNQ
jgi:hypothetical protein